MLKGLFFALLISVFAVANAVSADHKIDTQKSEIKWLGKKILGQHDGTINFKGGHLEFDGNTLTGGQFTVDMTSIVVKDIEDPEYNAKLKGHLESDDFFSVKKHKTATFKITKVNKTKSENGWDLYQVIGDMTIKGITNQIKFIAKVKKTDSGAEAQVKFEIDRTKWKVKYGSTSFFDSLGDKAIYDDFELDIHIKI